MAVIATVLTVVMAAVGIEATAMCDCGSGNAEQKKGGKTPKNVHKHPPVLESSSDRITANS